MKSEEIEKAARLCAMGYTHYEGKTNREIDLEQSDFSNIFKAGVEFANKHWQEKTRWISIEERLPEIREKEYMIYAKNNNVTYDYAILLIDTPDSLAYLKLAFTHWKEVDFPNY